MPKASIVVPAYNVERTIAETLRGLLSQTFEDFEIIVIDDGSTDKTCAVVRGFNDKRIKLIRQLNRGLAGARNSGIHAAAGDYIGFCDSDDVWLPNKLAEHVAHLDENWQVGLSFSGSAMIDDHSNLIGISQRPKTTDIRPRDVLWRNPVGNGSAPVIRRACLNDIAFRPAGETLRDWWFDETFRQSEDIECWMRIALTTTWMIEGIDEDLTLYRVNAGGLSSSIDKQLATWERMADKMREFAPAFAAKNLPSARAFQFRYLARRAVTMGQGRLALRMFMRGLSQSPTALMREPIKSVTTLGAAIVLALGGASVIRQLVPRVPVATKDSQAQ